MSISLVRCTRIPVGCYPANHVDLSLEPENENESGVRRGSYCKDKLCTEPTPGVNTVADILDYTARVHGDKKAMGWRDVLEIVEEEKEVVKTIEGKETKQMKTWKYFRLSEYKYINYIEVRNNAIELGKGLLELGLNRGDIFNVYAATRSEIDATSTLPN